MGLYQVRCPKGHVYMWWSGAVNICPICYPSPGSQGFFQLLPRYHAWRYEGRSPFDPQANVDAAYGLYAEQGWAPWSCQPW